MVGGCLCCVRGLPSAHQPVGLLRLTARVLEEQSPSRYCAPTASSAATSLQATPHGAGELPISKKGAGLVWIHPVEVTALSPSLPPARSGALLRGQLGHAKRTSTSEAGYIAQVGLPRTTRGCTYARGSQLQLGGRSLCLVRLPRAWTHANRHRGACAQHAETARLAAAHAAPRMHAAQARRTQARGSGMIDPIQNSVVS